MLTPYYQDGAVTLYCGDCREILPQLGPIDAIVTDPPFNVGKDYGTSQDHLSPEDYAALLGRIAQTTERQAWVTPTNRLTLFAGLLQTAYPVIVHRGAQGPKRWGWVDQFDMLLIRGKPRVCYTNFWDDIRLKGEGYFFREETYGHPGYTPYGILHRLCWLLCAPEEVVVDPFAGTGGTLVAAKTLGLRCIGIELDAHWCAIAARRLQETFSLSYAPTPPPQPLLWEATS